jgi:hypothetical protein
MFIGSTNGAIAYLATAMGAPWLPQTFTVPVKRAGAKPRDPHVEMEWGRRAAAPLLAAHADISVVHAYDRPSELHVKLLELGTIYRAFIQRWLQPGGTIYVVDCDKRSPHVKLGARAAFQIGSAGGIAPDELGVDGAWGFDPAILDELSELAQRRQYRVVRMGYREPDDLSPLVADVMSDWFRQIGLRDHHLLVGSSVLDPWWAIRTSSVPFWIASDAPASAERVKRYLERSSRWRSVDLMLSSQGSDLERWQEVIRRTGIGTILGCSRGLRQQVTRREWPAAPLEVERFERHSSRADHFRVDEFVVSPRDARTAVASRSATPRPISLPTW